VSRYVTGIHTYLLNLSSAMYPTVKYPNRTQLPLGTGRWWVLVKLVSFCASVGSAIWAEQMWKAVEVLVTFPEIFPNNSSFEAIESISYISCTTFV